MKLVISDPKTGKAYNLELDAKKEKSLIGIELGKAIDASKIGLSGYKIQFTGGSDKDGFPMRSDVFGRVRPRITLGGTPGFKPKEKGLRRRKRIRGKVITSDIVQVNVKIVKEGKKSIEALLGHVTEAEESKEGETA
ncbi:MAG: 30S ribosomal protein S6e [Candidatus Hydrothermarchaeales archaeon]